MVSLLRYDAARTALAEARRIDEVKDIRDKAIAVKAYARQAGDEALIRLAAEIKLWAERRAGALLAEMKKHQGGNPNLSSRREGLRPTLKALGITYNQSSAWQRVAEIPEQDFVRHLANADLAGLTLRTLLGALLVRERQRHNQRHQSPDAATIALTRLDDLIDSGLKFGTIYVDPPWLYDNQGTRAATRNHYNGLTVEQIAALPVMMLAAHDAHLHLWTTNAFLFACPKIFDAWGFEFRSSFVWVKKQMGIGNYWRNSHELLLTAVRGDAKSFAVSNLQSWILTGRGPHSAKPDQVRSMLEQASPAPRLELFGRREVKGWTVWGDQVAAADLFTEQ
jgi:N6-adenosine-specific RNA methylase IME4